MLCYAGLVLLLTGGLMAAYLLFSNSGLVDQPPSRLLTQMLIFRRLVADVLTKWSRMPTEVSLNYRDRIYSSYVTSRDIPLAPRTLQGLSPRLPYFRAMIQKHLPDNRGSSILDLGCGHGAFLYALQQENYRNARGVDDSPQQVEAAERLGIEGVRQGTVMGELAHTADASLDVVVAFDLIEHLTKTEIIPLTDEVRRVLRSGGRWLIHAPNAEGPFSGVMRHWDFTHEIAFTRTSLIQLLSSSGFSNVRCFEDRPIPHGLKSATRALLWQALRFGLLSYVAVETGRIDRGAVFTQNLLAVATRDA